MLNLSLALSSLLGLLFVFAGATAVVLMFQASARLKEKKSAKSLIVGHRIAGYFFILLFAFLLYYMVFRLQGMSSDIPFRTLIHLLLATFMVPLIFIKVLIARFYKTYYSFLMPIGLIIFFSGFVLVSIILVPSFVQRTLLREVSLASINMGSTQLDVNKTEDLVKQKCSQCHDLDRVFGATKDAPGWLTTVNRMRLYTGADISQEQGKKIISFLVGEVAVDTSSMAGKDAVGKAIADIRCKTCHTLERLYEPARTKELWANVLLRMEGHSLPKTLFASGEKETVLAFLVDNHSPDSPTAASQPIATNAPIEPEQSGSSVLALGVFALLGVGFTSLALRKPPPKTAALAKLKQSPVGAPKSKLSLPLRLVRVDPQTPNAKTLRFLVPEGFRFTSKPGQFLTFSWLIDGQKLVRSYSICSSPTQTAYIEITPKRVNDGYVSMFLNDKAAPGLVVEAKGPSGRFVFDERSHKKIALLAAGSGITPMMSILRYIDDLCLDTEVTLVYCVRTPDDVIFRKELAALAQRLPKFNLIVSLTKPDATWQGPQGRFTTTLLKNSVSAPNKTTFFICGPKSFMDGTRALVKELGVDESNILQESFGGPAAIPLLEEPSGISGQVEFARSAKTANIQAGCSLLETAEQHDVNIPYSCRQGQCGTCATQVLEGEVEMDVEDGLDPELKSKGYVLTCVGRAKGKVILDV
jgi:ferredoxin-NADP reductase/mono/diheme cytochrome c family protein